jgi:hypothetical protein
MSSAVLERSKLLSQVLSFIYLLYSFIGDTRHSAHHPPLLQLFRPPRAESYQEKALGKFREQPAVEPIGVHEAMLFAQLLSGSVTQS